MAGQLLYDDLIMDHIKNARNYRVIEDADRSAEGSNPLCGDEMTVYLRMEAERIRDISYQCTCCGISMASASMMTEQIMGKDVAEVRRLVQTFREMIERPADFESPRDAPTVQAMLETVRQYPSRVRCAALPWTTLGTLLDEKPANP